MSVSVCLFRVNLLWLFSTGTPASFHKVKTDSDRYAGMTPRVQHMVRELTSIPIVFFFFFFFFGGGGYRSMVLMPSCSKVSPMDPIGNKALRAIHRF